MKWSWNEIDWPTFPITTRLGNKDRHPAIYVERKISVSTTSKNRQVSRIGTHQFDLIRTESKDPGNIFKLSGV